MGKRAASSKKSGKRSKPGADVADRAHSNGASGGQSGKQANTKKSIMDDVASQSVEALAARRLELEAELQRTEWQLYNLETQYLDETSGYGNVLTGWDSFLSARARTGGNKGEKKTAANVRDEERLFSYSSATAGASISQVTGGEVNIDWDALRQEQGLTGAQKKRRDSSRRHSSIYSRYKYAYSSSEDEAD